jgi:hypothetical protein
MFLIGLAAFATAVVSRADDQAYLGIFAETSIMQMAGVKMPKLPAGFKMPAGIKMPGGMAMPGQPHRTLSVRLWSPGLAPDSATASIAPPSGLRVGDKMDLELYRPSPAESSGGGSAAPGGRSGSTEDFTIKIYWGSSDTVQPGQPKIIKIGDLTPEQQSTMAKRSQAARQGGESYFYKPNWTTGHWPTSSDPGEIADDASLLGTFSLTTNYTGNVTVDAPQGVDFLPAIEMTSPSLDQKPPLDTAIHFQWNSLPNALGQYASIMGMEGKNTMIIWSSSEVYNDRLMGENGYLQMAEVKDRVNDKLFMPGDSTQMTVPAGIFQNADFVMMDMTAWGPGSAREGVQPVPRIQTKSSLRLMLGGKKARGAGFGGGG